MLSNLNNTKKSLLKSMRSNKIVEDDKVIDAFRAISRELFVPLNSKKEAYIDAPLSIGYKQTISQPSTVFSMVEALELKKTDKVLEVGSGSGYEAAIISQLCDQVYSVEIVPELVNFAKENLVKAKIDNVKIIQYDGGLGYEQQAPYDKIVVSAACAKIPKALVDQLKDGGILVAPVGDGCMQKMIKVVKHNQVLDEADLGDYIFVPLTGEFGRV